MKLTLALLLALPTVSNAAVIWAEDFEGFDTATFDNIEDQSAGEWVTSPPSDPAFAAYDNDTGVASMGLKALAAGGLDPAGGATTLASAYSPLSASFTPGGAESIAVFSTYLYFDPNGVANLTDSFALTFYNQADDALASMVFKASATNGFVAVYRDNMVSQFDTLMLVPNNSAVRLDFLIDFSLNKWTGTLTPDGSSTAFSMFADVTFTENPAIDPGSLNMGSFGIEWIKESGSPTWGSNFILADNISLTSVPEPTTALLGGLGMLFLLKRRQR